MTVRRIHESDPLWPSFVAHLRRLNMARWVIGEDDRFERDDLHGLTTVVDGDVVGHIVLRLRRLVVPKTEWSQGMEHGIAGPDGTRLTETFVMTFAVDEAHRRRGHGRALQLAAIALSRDLGAWQMRSWSSLDKPAHYALKLSLGFTAVPAREPWGRDGTDVCGVHFLMSLARGPGGPNVSNVMSE